MECRRTGLSGGVEPRSYQVTPVLLGRRRATDRVKVRPFRSTARLRVSPPPAPSLTGTSVTSRPIETRMTLKPRLARLVRWWGRRYGRPHKSES
jgi:hypothetical protein